MAVIFKTQAECAPHQPVSAGSCCLQAPPTGPASLLRSLQAPPTGPASLVCSLQAPPTVPASTCVLEHFVYSSWTACGSAEVAGLTLIHRTRWRKRLMIHGGNLQQFRGWVMRDKHGLDTCFLSTEKYGHEQREAETEQRRRPWVQAGCSPR